VRDAPKQTGFRLSCETTQRGLPPPVCALHIVRAESWIVRAESWILPAESWIVRSESCIVRADSRRNERVFATIHKYVEYRPEVHVS
jgi:hypothetical protein